MDMENLIEENSKNKSFLYKQKTPLALKIIMDIFFALLVICLLTITIFYIIYLKTPVDGPSMMPTINAEYTDTNNIEDYAYINRFGKISSQDIIVAHKINNDNKYVIKRLIANSGEYIKIAKNDETNEIDIYIKQKLNSEPVILDEPYLYDKNDNIVTLNKFEALKINEELTFTEDGYLYIEEDKVFYLGDNRARSEDCSNYGPVSKKLIVGRVDIIQKYNESSIPIIYNFFINEIKTIFTFKK